MFSVLRKLIFARQMRSLIKIAIEAVYSEQLDINLLLRNIVDKKNVSLLRACIAIRVAADTKLGIEASMHNVLEDIRRAELSLNDLEKHRSIIEYNRARAEISLIKAEIEFEIDQRAPENSYQEVLYRCEKARKGPLSYQERQKLRRLTSELSEVERQLAERETYVDEKASKEAAEEAFRKMKAEVEAEKRMNGPVSKADLDKEYEDLINQFKEISMKPKE